MTKMDKLYLTAATVIFLATHIIAGVGDAPKPVEPAAATQEIQAEPLSIELAKASEWNIEMEDPQEDEKITAALLEQGYLRDDVPLPYELQDVTQTACETYGVPYALALGLMEVESGFQENACNGLCYGLMQLNKQYFPDNFTPAENVAAGVEFLGQLLERYSDTAAALTAYNAGFDTGKRDYANAVLAAAEKWE